MNERLPPRESWVGSGRWLGVLLALLCTGFVAYNCTVDSMSEPVEVVAIRDNGEVGIVRVSGRWVTKPLPDGWSPIASVSEFDSACHDPELEAEEAAKERARFDRVRTDFDERRSNTAAADTTGPTVTVNVVRDPLGGQTGALLKNERATVEFRFDEAVKGFTLDDVVAENAELSSLSTTDDIRFTATLTPRAGVDDAKNVVTVTNTGYVDAAGNSGTGTTSSASYAIDTVAADTRLPTLKVNVDDERLLKNETTTVTFSFDEVVYGFSVDDVVAENAKLSALSTTDNITFTATLTPETGIADETNVVTVIGTSYVDTSNNPGMFTAHSNNYAIDTEAPNDPVRRRLSFESCRRIGLSRAGPRPGGAPMHARMFGHQEDLHFSGSHVRYNEWAGKDGGMSTDEYDVVGRQVRPLRHSRVNVGTVLFVMPGLLFMLGLAVVLLRPIGGDLAGFLYDRRQRARARDQQRPSS